MLRPATGEIPAPERYLSSYRRTFAAERDKVLSTQPQSSFVPDRSFPLNSKLKADTWQQATMCPGPQQAGRGGKRGEFTRWPGESGSRYGISVFADEYAAGR